jgi:succinate dehydrogenase/fumarate reductase flavoprotein subunit
VEVLINFHQGSFTEGRLAAKAAVKYIEDKKAEGLKVSDKQCEDFKAKVYKPLETYTLLKTRLLEEQSLQVIFLQFKVYNVYKELWMNMLVELQQIT